MTDTVRDAAPPQIPLHMRRAGFDPVPELADLRAT